MNSEGGPPRGVVKAGSDDRGDGSSEAKTALDESESTEREIHVEFGTMTGCRFISRVNKLLLLCCRCGEGERGGRWGV